MATNTLSRERRTVVHPTSDGGAAYETVETRTVRDTDSGTITNVVGAPSRSPEAPADPGVTEVRPQHGTAYPPAAVNPPSPLRSGRRR